MRCFARFGKPATLLKVALIHGWFLRFLNCTNGTKSSNAPRTCLKILTKNNGHSEDLETET